MATKKVKSKKLDKLGRLASLQFVIAFSSIFLALIPMTYTAVSVYSRYSDEFIDNAVIYTNQIMDQLKLNINEYFSQTIEVNLDVENMLAEHGGVIDDEFEEQLATYIDSRNDVVTIAFYDYDGTKQMVVPGVDVDESYSLSSQEWFDEVITRNYLYHITVPYVQNIQNKQGQWVVSVCKRMTVQEEDLLLIVDISLKDLDDLCHNMVLGGSGYVYITDQSGDVVYHPQQALIASGIKKEMNPFFIEGEYEIIDNDRGEEVLMTKAPLNFVEWQLVGITYIENVSARNEEVLQELIITIPFIVLFIIMLSWFVSGMITNPIKNLERNMNRVQNGDFDALIDLKTGEKEVMELAKAYNIMVIRIRDLIEENKREHEAKRQSDLNALQAQINPHFLYNTLDSIMWMAECGKNEDVVEMVTALARLFRISISKGRRVIRVAEELEHARNYLFIQKIRYKEKFTFNIDADEDTLNLKSVKLILQPIIENALYHGIEYMVDEGHIEIKAKKRDGYLYFTVEDNGLGMDEKTRYKLLHTDDEIISDQGSGVGVRNVDERIKLRYGTEYGLSIESEIEQGTKVTIKLPIMEGDQ